MIAPWVLSRRIFLRVLLGLGGLGLARPARALAKFSDLGARGRLIKGLDGLFSRKESAKVIGREYLKVAPQENDVGRLVDMVCSLPCEGHARLGEAEPGEFREVVGKQLRKDFEQGRTVKVDGWILSETEARLCALVYLLDK